MDKTTFNKELLGFINDSPTAFHAVRNISAVLSGNGFVRLNESDSWNIESGKKYFVTRNDSSIIAFSSGTAEAINTGIRILGAHTDSPCLKLKPEPLYAKTSCHMFGVEVYGGVMLRTWFDRELSIAGRITFSRNDNKQYSVLVDFKRPMAIIPSLALHMNKDANTAQPINAQKELPALVACASGESEMNFNEILKTQIELEHKLVDVKAILAHDLFLYDCNMASVFGIKNEFIAGARLDNLLSCFIGLKAALNAEGVPPFALVFNDHEETGSLSFHGASGSFLRDILGRLYPTVEEHARVLNRSMLISMDNAHASHPNYAESHEPHHRSVINGGPAIKVNAGQRYSTNSETHATIRAIAMKLDLPVQTFVMRSDIPCGTTIGPITSAETGVKAVDIGVPTFAMHSIRETAGVDDAYILFQILDDLLKGGSE